MRWESYYIHTYIRFSSSISPTTLIPVSATYSSLSPLDQMHMCACVCVRIIYVSIYRHLLICVYQAGVPTRTKSHRHTSVSLDHTSPHVVKQTGHRDTCTHSQKEKTSNIALFISVFHLQNPMVNPGSQKNEMEENPPKCYPIYPCVPPNPSLGKGTPPSLSLREQVPLLTLVSQPRWPAFPGPLHSQSN